MKKIACVDPGIIVYGTVLKDGEISQKDRKDVTKDCIIAMFQHISCSKDFFEVGASGYEWNKVGDDDTKIQLVLYDTAKYTLVPNGSLELKEES